MAASVVRRKFDELPAGQLTVIVPEKQAALAFLLGDDIPYIVYRRKNGGEFRKSLSEIRSGGFDTLYLLPKSFSAAWLGFRSKIKRRRGIRAQNRSPLLTDPLPFFISAKNRHITLYYSDVLEAACEPPENWAGAARFLSGLAGEEGGQPRGLPVHEPAGEEIVLCPGAAYGPAKQWPGYRDLTAMFPERKFIILGDKKDFETGEEIAAVFSGRVKNLAGKTSLKEAMEIIARASAVVSNDSGLMHAAAYIGTPVVGIFGSTSPQWTRPLGKLTRIAHVKQECSPCFQRECELSENRYKCQKSVTAGYVAGLLGEVVR